MYLVVIYTFNKLSQKTNVRKQVNGTGGSVPINEKFTYM